MKCGFVQPPANIVSRNWFLGVAIKLCSNFKYIFMWSFLLIGVRSTLTENFCFLPEFYLDEEVYPSFSKFGICLEREIVDTPSVPNVFVFASAINSIFGRPINLPF